MPSVHDPMGPKLIGNSMRQLIMIDHRSTLHCSRLFTVTGFRRRAVPNPLLVKRASHHVAPAMRQEGYSQGIAGVAVVKLTLGASAVILVSAAVPCL